MEAPLDFGSMNRCRWSNGSQWGGPIQAFNDLRIQGKGTGLALWVETKVSQNTKRKATA